MIHPQFSSLPKSRTSSKQGNDKDKENSSQQPQHSKNKEGQQQAKKKDKTEQHGQLLFKLNMDKVTQAETEKLGVHQEMDVDQEIEQDNYGLATKKRNKQKHKGSKEQFGPSEESITSYVWNESVHDAHIQSKLQPSKVNKKTTTEAKGEHNWW